VDKPRKKPIIGILGGLCSGKSTAAAEFGKLGCAVIDADRIAHKLLDKADIKDKIAAAFGKVVLDSAGKINHKKLADIVFSNADKLSALNGIIHPPVLARIEALIKQYSRQPAVRAIVLDMPLLAEVGWQRRCDRLIFVDCSRQLRLERAKNLGILNENQLQVRENFQISLDSKAAIADNIVDNNSGFSALVRQVTEIFSCISG
jgi:dephospho-CoA kinase